MSEKWPEVEFGSLEDYCCSIGSYDLGTSHAVQHTEKQDPKARKERERMRHTPNAIATSLAGSAASACHKFKFNASEVDAR